MKILVHSQVDARSIRGSLGVDEYSYYFVRSAFSRALQGFAEIVAVQDPAQEVDALYDAALAEGRRCLFLSFAPPNKTVLGLRCPTVPVFAWEFGSIPNEVWDEDVRNDWRSVLSVCHGAIALSSFAAGAVRRAMGEHYPVASIPAPVFDRFAVAPRTAPPGSGVTTIRITGTVLDTDLIPAYRRGAVWPRESIPLLTPGPIAVRGLPPPPGVQVVIVQAPPRFESQPPEAPLAETAAGPVEDVLDASPAAPPGVELGEASAASSAVSSGEPPGELSDEAAAEPPFAAAVVQATAPAHPLALTVAAPRMGVRRRLQVVKHVALEWYRRRLRDRLPAPIRSANAKAGRAAYRLYAALSAAPPALPLPTHRPETERLTFAPPIPIPAGPPPDIAAIEAPELAPELAPDLPPVAVPDPVPHLVPAPEPKPERESAAMLPHPVTTCFEVTPVARPAPPEQVALDGVIYVSIFSPRDGRKNWQDILSAFCWALRDRPDATLVLKIVSQGPDPTILDPMLRWEQNIRDRILESAPFKCRVVVLDGYLETPDLHALIASASYCVNASHCEGLCLPVTEFMSGGVPAIAPRHTAFEDYITADNAFVIESGVEYNVWPADKRELFRTSRYRIDWNALMLAFRESYRVAKEDPQRYVAMSRNARDTMQDFCGIEPVAGRLRAWLDTHGAEALERVA